MISERYFRVIELSEIRNGLVLGIDSPIHRTERIEFDIKTEKYSSEIEIKTGYNNGYKQLGRK